MQEHRGTAVARHAVAVAAGDAHTMVLLSDGTLWAAGANSAGLLGDGTEDSRAMLVHIMSDVASVSAGSQHTLVVKRDRTLWGFGSSDSGLLGLGNDAPIGQLTPTRIMTEVVAASAGEWHSLAIRADGTLWVFGSNSNGQLGGEVELMQAVPVPVLALGANAVAVSAGARHSLVVTRDQELWAFGDNSSGQLGLGVNTSPLQPKPQRVTALDNVIGVSSGGNHTMAITADGYLYGWGQNSFGQLGDTTTTDRSVPVAVMPGVVAVACGSTHTAAVKADATLWTFGHNVAGQLGNGSAAGFSANFMPQQVLDRVVGVAAGGAHTMIVRNDGSLWGIGAAVRGDGSVQTITTPQRVSLPDPID